MEEQYFKEVDDCIMAAYNHVKQTGCKMRPYTKWKFNHKPNREDITHIGYISDDNKLFVITYEDHNKSLKRKLVRDIQNHKIKVIDFVNKQLIMFL